MCWEFEVAHIRDRGHGNRHLEQLAAVYFDAAINHWIMFVCLIFYVSSTIFQLNRERSSWVEPVLSWDKCVLLKDHNAVTPVRLKPVASASRVKHSTTEPLRSRHWIKGKDKVTCYSDSLHPGYKCGTPQDHSS